MTTNGQTIEAQNPAQLELDFESDEPLPSPACELSEDGTCEACQ